MLRVLIYKELIDYVNSKLYLFLCCIIIILFITSGVIFNVSFKYKNSYSNGIANKVEESIQNNPRLCDIVFINQQATVTPSKTSFLFQSPVEIPDGIEYNYFTKSYPNYIKPSNKYLFTTFSMDWSNIILYILSFLTICISHDKINGERIDGTLKLILVNSISKWKIIFGKYLSALLAISLPMFIGMLICLTIIFFNPIYIITFQSVVFIITFIIGSLIFISLNILFSFLISTITKSPSISLNINLIIWFVLCIIIPNTGWLLSKGVYPIQSLDDVEYKEELWRSSLNGCPGNWNPAWNSPNDELLSRINCYNRYDEMHNNMQREYLNHLFNQTDRAISYSSISPYGTFRFFAEQLSGNAYTAYKEFYNQQLNYITEFKGFCKEVDRKDAHSFHLIWNEQDLAKPFMSNQKILINQIPTSTHYHNSFVVILKICLIKISYLFIITSILFYCTFICFVRYDVR